MDIAPNAPLEILGMSLNMTTLFMSWIVMGLVVFAAWTATRRMAEMPGRWQAAMELFVDFFDTLSDQALGERGRKYVPFVGTVFLFVWGSNLIGLLPGCAEPTRDLNTPIGLAVLAIACAHLSAIVVKGFRGWWWQFFEPAFPANGTVGTCVAVATGVLCVGVYALIVVQVCTGLLPDLGATGRAVTVLVLAAVAGFGVLTGIIGYQRGSVPNVLMAPLNFVGEVGKSISLPFRLYGNIFGGAVIIIVISTLLKHILLPVVLMFFFGLFVGTIQAFVFAMLSLTYIAVALAEEEPAPESSGDVAPESGG